MFRCANLCNKCDAPTSNPEDCYGEFVCDDCLDNEAERAWERHCSSFYGGDGPLSLREQQEQARRLK